jgi:gas vesicle protein
MMILRMVVVLSFDGLSVSLTRRLGSPGIDIQCKRSLLHFLFGLPRQAVGFDRPVTPSHRAGDQHMTTEENTTSNDGAADRIKDFIEKTGESAEARAARLKDFIADTAEKAKDKAGDVGEFAKDKAGDVADFAKDKADDVADFAKDKAGDVKEFVADLRDGDDEPAGPAAPTS